MGTQADRLNRWIAAVREAVGLGDDDPGDATLGPRFVACIVVAAEIECRMAGLEPTPRNLHKIARALSGAGMLGGLDMIPHPTNLVPQTECSGAYRRDQ